MILTLFLVIFGVFLHEFGHLYAMQKYGIKVESLTMGIPIPGLTLKFQHRKLFKGVPIYFSPVLLMGGVKPKNWDSINALPMNHQLDIYGGGLIMSFFFASALLVPITTHLDNALLVILAGFILLYAPKIFTRYVFPLCSALMVISIPFILQSAFEIFGNGGSDSGSMIESQFVKSITWRESLFESATLTATLGILNLMPLYILDGGRLVSVYLSKWSSGKFPHIYRVTTGIMTAFIFFACAYDLCAAGIRIVWKILFH